MSASSPKPAVPRRARGRRRHRDRRRGGRHHHRGRARRPAHHAGPAPPARRRLRGRVVGAHEVGREPLGGRRAHGRRRRRDRRAAGLARRLVHLVAARAPRGARRRRDPGAVRAGRATSGASRRRDAGPAGAARPARRAHHEPQVRRREGGEVPPRGRVPRARHRAGRPAPRRRPAAARARRRGPRRRRARHGRRRRLAGAGLVASPPSAGVPMVVIPAGTRNHFALDIGLDRDDVVGALDAYGEALEQTDRPRRRERPRVRQQRLARPVRGDRRARPSTATTSARSALAALPEMLGPGQPSRSTCASTRPTARGTTAPTSSRCPTGPTAPRATTLTSRPRLDTGELGVLTLVVPDAASATRAVAAVATAQPGALRGLQDVERAGVRGHLRRAHPGRPGRRVARAGPAAGVQVAAGRAAPAAAQARDRLLTGRARHAPARPARPVEGVAGRPAGGPH